MYRAGIWKRKSSGAEPARHAIEAPPFESLLNPLPEDPVEEAVPAQATPPPPPPQMPAAPRAQPDDRPIDAWLLAEWAWQARLAIAAWIVAGLITAFVAATLISPRFTAYTDILINPAQIRLPSEGLYNPQAQREAQLLDVGGKMRMLTSTNVLSRVVERLSLDTDAEFVGGGLFEGDARLAALRSLYERVEARRDGQSYVVTLSVWSEDPAKSVEISQAVIASFRDEIADADAANASRTATSLNDRLDALRLRAGEAESNVEVFRAQNRLEGSGGRGELLSSQSLSQLNAQVNDARARVIAAQARDAELRAMRSGDSVVDPDASPILTSLRVRQAELQRQISAESVIFGPRHPNVAMLQPQLASVEATIGREIDRMIEASGSQVEQAQATLDELTTQLDGVRSLASRDNEALVRLRELEREAEVQSAIYSAYLQRTAEIVEGSNIDATDIRVISPAVPPEARNWPPRTLYLLALGAMAGLAMGLGWAVMSGFAVRYAPVLRNRLAPAAG